MRTATVRYTETGCELSLWYDENFLHDLKSSVPYAARHWDADRKLWVIQERFVVVVLEIARRYFRLVELNARQQQHTGSSQKPPTAHAVLHLLPTAPPELVKAAFRTLAQKCHPDHGGTTEQMQRLNQAYSELIK